MSRLHAASPITGLSRQATLLNTNLYPVLGVPSGSGVSRYSFRYYVTRAKCEPAGMAGDLNCSGCPALACHGHDIVLVISY